jgi:hypothetical protein
MTHDPLCSVLWPCDHQTHLRMECSCICGRICQCHLIAKVRAMMSGSNETAGGQAMTHDPLCPRASHTQFCEGCTPQCGTCQCVRLIQARAEAAKRVMPRRQP